MFIKNTEKKYFKRSNMSNISTDLHFIFFLISSEKFLFSDKYFTFRENFQPYNTQCVCVYTHIDIYLENRSKTAN